MSLEYRSGHWNVVYYPRGRHGPKARIQLPDAIKDQEAAQAEHDSFLKTIRAARGITSADNPQTGMTISQVWDKYLEWYKIHRAPSTYADIVNVGAWVKKYIGVFLAEDISIQHASIYTNMRLANKKRHGHRAINKELSYISGMVKWAGRNKYIEVRRFEFDALPYKRPLPQVLSVGETVEIIKHADPFYSAYFLCLYALGLRSIEARNLTWNNVDWSNSTINMIQKGGSSKSLPLYPALESSLKEIAAKRPALKPGDPIFFSPRTGRAVKDIRKPIARACEAAKITKRVTPHLFRHSCATHMLDAGENIRIIQKYLGHSQLTTTQIYTHVSMSNLRNAQESILQGMGHGKRSKGKGRDTGKKTKQR